MSVMPKVNERWRFKQNRGSGTFTVVRVSGDRVVLRAAWDSSKTKNVSLRTLRSDYEPSS